MLAILYLILCMILGYTILTLVLPELAAPVVLPAAFGTGTLFLTWALYIVSYFAAVPGGSGRPLFWGNLVVLSVAAVFCLLMLFFQKRNKRPQRLLHGWKPEKKEAFFFLALTAFVTWIFFYVFQVKNGNLYSGFTVFSDYAPHTAMIRSFSRQTNFPTQYPHFGGEDVKYHFMFQFLTGNLEYLGLRIDLAYNLASILSMIFFLMMLYELSIRIMGSKATGVLAVCAFFLRSGLSFFRFVWEHIQTGDLWDTLLTNTSFIGYTMNENWGLWCFNVYLNQRHLAFGLLIVTIALWIFLDWLDRGEAHPEKGMTWFADRLFSGTAWTSVNLRTAVFTGILMGMCAFWNGAAVIGGLLILAGFGLFSDGKLDYAVMAAITIFLSVVQSRVFMTSSAVQPSLYFGLLASDPSFPGVFWFLLQISGVYFVGCMFLALFLKRKQRSIMLAFFLPMFFAFTISLTPDISVNHKYVMISYAMLTMFWAHALCRLWQERKGGRILAVMLIVLLFATGIYDFVIVLMDNDAGHRIAVNEESTLTRWLDENLDSSDLLLSPQYSINEVTMSGVMLYNGWPYYAWSAGYDTDYRTDLSLEIYTGSDAKKVKELVAKEEITYIIYEDGMKIDEQICREDVIAELYERVFTSENGTIRVYDTNRRNEAFEKLDS